jgi:hypothetical protein
MVIADEFIYIHMPKTGGTFVTVVLTRIHESPPSRWARVRRAVAALLPSTGVSMLSYGPLLNVEPKHGTCHDVPTPYQHRPFLSTVRSPYDWYVSQYEFAWWKRTFEYHPEPHPTPVGLAIEQALPAFVEEHPEFPELTFEAFIELCDRASLVYEGEAGKGLGLITHGFIRYFYRNMDVVLSRLNRDYIRSGRYREDMFAVEFLHTHRLNRDLYDALVARGYAPKDVAFILNLEKILPMGRGRGDSQAWEKYYTPGLKAHVREREWMLFEMFPELDV